jgi:NAD(P)H dehydrogenase (quinone)
MSKIAVVYYSATGHVHEMAEAVVKGAKDAGAEVRLRRVVELAPEEVIRRQDAWREHYERTVPLVAEVALDDLEWADGLAFGTPTRFGLPAAQLKEFIDQTGAMWVKGRLANKVATSFTSSQNAHGGQESTLLALNNVFYHWGCVIVPPGYTHAVVAAAGGNPYGASYPAGAGDAVSAEALTAAHYQGYRLAQYAGRLVPRPVGSAPKANGTDRSADPLALDPYSPPHYSPLAWQGKVASP